MVTTMLLALSAVSANPAPKEEEWTLARARKEWSPMVRPVMHVGVPGFPFQTGVMWDGALVFGPIFYTDLKVMQQDMKLHNASPMHVSFGYGDTMKLVDRKGTGNPQIRRQLDNGSKPIPSVSTREGSIDWDQHVFAHLFGKNLSLEGVPGTGDALVTEVEFEARNVGNEVSTAHLWMHFGDTSKVHFGYKCSQDAELAPALPHRFESPFGLVDGRVRYVVPTPQEGIIVWHDSVADVRGVGGRAARVLEWRVLLKPGRSAKLRLAIPYGLLDPTVAKRILSVSFYDTYLQYWAAWGKLDRYRNGFILTPDPSINDYVAAIPGQMAQQVAYRNSTDTWMYKTSPNHYEGYWPCNAAKALPTFDYRGLTKLNERVLSGFVKNQTGDVRGLDKRGMGQGDLLTGEGYAKVDGFLGNFGEWTANPLLISHGLGMWALAQHYRITREEKWLRAPVANPLGKRSPLEAMIKAFDWVSVQRRRTMHGERVERRRSRVEGSSAVGSGQLAVGSPEGSVTEGQRDRGTEGLRDSVGVPDPSIPSSSPVNPQSRRPPYYGLLPPASAHDWLAGSTIFNDAWCIYGMTEIVRLLREIKHPRADEMAKELADYRRCLHDRYVEATAKSVPVAMPDGTSIQFVPRMVTEPDFRTIDWTYTGYGPVRAGAMGALDPFDPLVNLSLRFLDEGMPKGEGPYFSAHNQFPDIADVNWGKIADPQAPRHWLWRHYVEYETMWPVGGHLFLARDDLPRFFEFLFNNLAVAVHKDWKVGVESLDGVPSCAPGDGERWQIIRRMFVNEIGGYDGSQQSLFLLQAMPREWLKPGAKLGVKDMGTSFGGKLNLDVKVAKDGETVSVILDTNGFAAQPKEVWMRLRSESGKPLRSATVNGKAAKVLGGDRIAIGKSFEGRYTVRGKF